MYRLRLPRPHSLTITTWDVKSFSEPYPAPRGGRCIFTGRGFRSGSMVRHFTLTDGTEGFKPSDGAFGFTQGEGSTWFTHAVFDMTRLPEFLQHSEMQSITLFSRDGHPTTFTERNGDGGWLKHMAFRITAKMFDRYVQRSFAFSASTVGGTSWHDHAARLNVIETALDGAASAFDVI